MRSGHPWARLLAVNPDVSEVLPSAKPGPGRERGAVCCGPPARSRGRVPQESEKRLLLTARAGYPGRREALGCGLASAWIFAPSRPSVTVLWLAGHAEQTCFTQPVLWYALLPGIWDICRKSGPAVGFRSRRSWRPAAVD